MTIVLRQRFANRRESTSLPFDAEGVHWVVSYSCLPDGMLGEIFHAAMNADEDGSPASVVGRAIALVIDDLRRQAPDQNGPTLQAAE